MQDLSVYLLMLLMLQACQNQGETDSTTEAPQRMSQKKIVDLSHAYSDETVYWVTAREFELDTVFKGQTEKGYYYSAFNFSTAEHGGTHIDAPIHFAEKGLTVDQLPLEKLMGPAIKIDVSAMAMGNPDYLITIKDLQGWEQKHNSQIPDGSIVLLQTGFSKYYPNKVEYLGTNERGEQAIKLLHFPGLAPEAAQWLVDNRSINSIGIDTPSIDFGQSQYFKSHVILLGENIPAFENLTRLDQLPDQGFEVIALPMKIEGGSGAPLRIVAVLKE
ncbi:cyclase family protein [Flagellimonas myxillae]|uniref:cyclase family protein n=1 Tax=Flagellimonas myxillae TaxID=2942214 RepID=UPI00201F9960|nr:cyclase family protein [Muricauda myxillae]MCL6266477.1 cyclase family protein [Muricauda myxillae]